MAGLNRSRVAELIVDAELSSARRGSGYRVSGKVVLTAAHVVRNAVSLRLRFNADRPDEWVTDGVVLFEDAETDTALISVDNRDAKGMAVVEFGQIGARAAVLPFESVGFPRFKLRTDSPTRSDAEISRYRDAVHLHGMVPSLSNSREGTLELVVEPPEPDPDPYRSPWEGMSGAAVWSAGRIIGVVTQHHRSDGLGRLAAAPIAAAWPMLAQCLGLTGDSPPDVIPPSWSDTITEGYTAQVEDIAPESLLGREVELAEITRFCAGDESYQWWQAGPWYGKTALASWLVLHPPVGVTVVSFFITGRLAGQADSAAFTEALIEQLAVISGERAASTSLARDAQRRRLLKTAAERLDAGGQRLLLVVDGLDGDRGAPPVGPSSIASLLPSRPPAGLRVLVTSRPQPGLPMDVPANHPLRLCQPRHLTRSDLAKEIELHAKGELAEQLSSGDAVRLDILGYITASGGGLTSRELSELTHLPRWTVEEHLGGVVGRSLGTQISSDTGSLRSEPVHIFGHETLREIAAQELADVLEGYRARIDEWVDTYWDRHWPDDSPRYVFRPYARLLQSTGHAARLAALATDHCRHDQMLARTFGDVNALEEIVAAHMLHLKSADDRDIAQTVMLAVERNRLAIRSGNIPIDLPNLWVRLGSSERGVGLARSITEKLRQVEAMTAIAKAFASAGQTEDAERTAREAEFIARSITNRGRQAQALIMIARALTSAGQTTDARLAVAAERVARDAESIAHTIATKPGEALALAAIAQALAAAGHTSDAERIARDAEFTARSTTDEHDQTRALTAVGQAMADSGKIADAKRIARDLTTEYSQTAVLIPVARALADVGQTTDAERIARNISDKYGQAQAMTAIAQALAKSGQTTDAERIAGNVSNKYGRARAMTAIAGAHAKSGRTTDAERIARNITDQSQQARALVTIAQAMAATRDTTIGEPTAATERLYRDITRLALDAELIARSITTRPSQAEALTAIAQALAAAGNTVEAERIGRDAENIARGITDKSQQAQAMTAIAQALAVAGHSADAELLARVITHDLPDRNTQAQVLSAVAQALAAAGHTTDAERITHDAESVACAITNKDDQAEALTGVALAFVATGSTTDGERIARSITDTFDHFQALTAVAQALAAAGNTIDAERLARDITDEELRVKALTAVAQALAAAGNTVDAERLARDAELIARDITDEELREKALAAVAQALAAAGHTAAAESIARDITDEELQAKALTAVAQALAAAGNTTRAELLCVQALLGPDWVQAVRILVTLSRDTTWIHRFFDLANTVLRTHLVT